jgi:membrane associated rhomboid family serine protease
MGIVDEIKYSFRNGSYLTKLIYVNILIWIIVRLVFVGYKLSGADGSVIVSWLALPASFQLLLTRPWTVFTYMFLHFEFLHILFNVLWLYWFGRIFLEYHNERKLLSLYLFGGFSGGLAYILSYNLIPVFGDSILTSQLLGASASVIAIVIAISVYVPNHVIHLVFLGPVKIVYIAVISVILYIIDLSGDNAGGNFAHLGGVVWGWFYMTQIMAGRDLTGWFDSGLKTIISWFRPHRKLRIKYDSVNPDHIYNRQKVSQQDEVNRILDKIGQSGYESLTFEERETLFKIGKKK